MKINVAVLYGGRSAEHEVSLRSAESVIAALDPKRYEVRRILIQPDGTWDPGPILPEPGANPGIDVVFPVLHGTFGEDGTVQGLLELAALPYVGPGVLASAVNMDKVFMKRLLRDQGLPVVEWVELQGPDPDAEQVTDRFDFPVFVKPANLGSSVGISKAKDRESLDVALHVAARFDRKILVERAIAGREFECSVMGNEQPKAAIPCEIRPSKEFYDYEDKYLLDKAEAVVPANLPPERVEEIRRLAVNAYKATDCEGMARVDFLLEAATDRLYINEINTIPGFTSISMYPKMWEAAGIPMGELVDRLIELALKRSAERKRLAYSRQ